jgi:hypothetical protein
MTNYYMGVDPGSKGAICLLDPLGNIEFYANPDIKGTNSWHLFKILDKIASSLPVCYVEDVHSLYGMSAKSNFSFGRNVQAVHTLLHLVEIDFELVQPKVWQKAVGIADKKVRDDLYKGSIKQAVVARAKEIYPSATLHGPRGGILDGPADALMLAHYALITDMQNVHKIKVET